MSSTGAFERQEADAVMAALMARVGEKRPERRLHAIRRVTELLGDPQRMYGVIHLAGTAAPPHLTSHASMDTITAQNTNGHTTPRTTMVRSATTAVRTHRGHVRVGKYEG